MLIEPVAHGDAAITVGMLERRQARLVIVPLDPDTGSPEFGFPLAPALVGAPDQSEGTVVAATGRWDDAAAGLLVTSLDAAPPAPTPRVHSVAADDGESPRPRIKVEPSVWERLEGSVLSWSATPQGVELVAFDHDHVRAILRAIVEEPLMLHEPPFGKRDYQDVAELSDLAEAEGVLQAISWGVTPQLWLQRVTPEVAAAMHTVPDGIMRAHVQVVRVEPGPLAGQSTFDRPS